MKKVLICGGAGFIGHNLAKKMKQEGWEVDVVDIKERPDFEESPADTYFHADLRTAKLVFTKYDRIVQLSADMGGAGFVFTGDNDADILTNSVSINLNILNQLKEQSYKGTIFYSSSVCIYSPEATLHKAREEEAYPATPDSNYGWEKLYSERLYEAYAKNYGLDIRIARFNNTYGPHGVFKGGREKSPAAICRKVMDADPTVEIWGDGRQIREYVYIDDLLDGIEVLMQSDIKTPVNIGPDEYIVLDDLVELARQVEDKQIEIKHIDGPIGLQTRLTSNEIIKSLGWSPKISTKEGITKTYNWIKNVRKS